MFNFNPALLTDFYKQCHAKQHDTKITKLISYYTPRLSRHTQKWAVVFDKGDQFNLTTLNEIRQRFWNNKF